MAGLLDLPDEILTFIFEELVEEGVFWRYQTSWKDKQSLLCLMRTNRRLNVLASRILMRGIDITIMSTDEDGEEDAPNFQYDGLLATLRGNELLAGLVRRVSLVWEMPGAYAKKGPNTDWGICNKKSNELLALLRNIELLRVRCHRKCLPFTLDFLDIDRNSAPNLRQFYLPWFGTSFKEIVEYLQIPGLETLYVSFPASVKLRSDLLEVRRDLQPSDLAKLYLGSSYFPISELSSLLAMLSNLKTLSLGLPFPDAREETVDGVHASEQKRMLSPVCIGNLLESFRHSLVDLRLWKERHRSAFNVHDGSRLDLSSFEKLRTLNLPSDCLFVSDGPDPSRDGLWKLLPPQLEDLKIWFDHENHFAYTKSELNNVLASSDLYKFNLAALPKDLQRYNWLQELVDHKPDCIPHLCKIEVEETRVQVHGARYLDPLKRRSWRPPGTLKRNFTQAGIRLRARIRVPKGRVPDKRSYWATTEEEDTGSEDEKWPEYG